VGGGADPIILAFGFGFCWLAGLRTLEPAGATMAGRIVAIMRRSDENGGKRCGEDGGKKFVAKMAGERYGENNGGML